MKSFTLIPTVLFQRLFIVPIILTALVINSRIAFAICIGIDEEGNTLECGGGNPTPPPPDETCPVCPDYQSQVNLLAQTHLQNFPAMSTSAFSEKAKFDDAVKECSKISLFPYEEWKDGSKDDDIFNCQDYSRWFRECMIRSGFENTYTVDVQCDNCQSGDSNAHVLNAYKNEEGLYCPHEPQLSYPQTRYSSCCKATLDESITCAGKIYCDRQVGKGDLCCTPGIGQDSTSWGCKAKCHWMIDGPDGKPVLKCGRIKGITEGDNDFPTKEPLPTGPADPCKDAQIKCAQENPNDSCRECKKLKVPECRIWQTCQSMKSNRDCSLCCESLYPLPPDGGVNYSLCLNTAQCGFKW